MNLEEQRPISAIYILENSDKKEIEERFGKGIFSSDQINLCRDYSGELFYTLRLDENVVSSSNKCNIEVAGEFLILNIHFPQKPSHTKLGGFWGK
ncbi:MAG TPA: hypothetical protein ENN22_02230 [bacterium]|nr:hypothetical protein [bacterium]